MHCKNIIYSIAFYVKQNTQNLIFCDICDIINYTQKDKGLIIMNNKEYKPVANHLALTTKKENRLTIRSISKTTIRMTAKIVFYLTILIVANMFV